MMKLLVAFDFDHTIIQFNSDIVIEHLIPVEEISQLKKRKDYPLWLDYMQDVFNLLHKLNISKDVILKTCGNCPSTEGMIDVIKKLKLSMNADIIIISDSNTVFIEHWLKYQNLYHLIDKIYTNPAEFDDDGLLKVKNFQDQDWCKYSTRNLCKAYVLEKHLEEEARKNNVYDVVAYVGDGRNDICPLFTLRDIDHCFPRVNYALNRTLNENKEVLSKIKASIHPWKKGSDILDVLEQLNSQLG